MGETILSVDNLDVSFQTNSGLIKAVRGVSFDLKKGETLAIVGESGSGKSVTAKSIMQLLPKQSTRIDSGSIVYGGNDLLEYGNKEIEKIRGKEIAMVFQDPMTSLNPTMKIGKQVMEGLIKHNNIRKKEAKKRSIELLTEVGIPYAEERMNSFPHEFSGGMRQRVVIAMALACDPKVLIADEPTTALDVTIQAQILNLMKELQKKTGTSILIITHDLGVVVNMAQRIAVMYAGEIVETGTLREIFYKPKHPYTWGLLQSMPKMHQDQSVPLIPIAGSPPDVSLMHDGCPFAARCPYVMKVCHNHKPDQTQISVTHAAACWLEDDWAPEIKQPEKIGGVSNS
ncbi:peptide ABC transporter ATP-binding protein [Salipaludibacillus neizhouensis]|uniref:Peptide ABC transporter ATP-binding protein n=1 Tax=Salipaludibacillus neizhouensis TaxID=885475 RepID=A0A3A9K293_9BACI|nr:ABC transporter ATP-binding protein [Salipaludibacillus neizhouensis]RKL66847.1 peptide ABC transporter ATP-binding protein [Salipaludibacillus neizhouensis]